ncbi:tyrosine--tRNA ligase [Candidatus Saccharibacteria bacterium]|nr:MAG: tyrosine--tRNA ligase [Candidatus Saccharibacteria bacterium]
MKLSEELQWRGFVNQTTLADISDLDTKTWTFYFGVDPSAPSMTIGNLATAMMVRHFIDHGHKAILLVGGATGLIGDPDGKAEERVQRPAEDVAADAQAIAAQYQTIFDGQAFEMVDNYDWFKDMRYLQFLRDVGKHVPMRQMLSREFIKERLGEGASGISYAEFSYALIQGYDFLHLMREYGATLQLAGSDQWGNSIAGVELIRRITGQDAHVLTAPLVVNKATGKKFGKSEDGAIWLNKSMTSVYKFYQFWLNLEDEGVIDYMKIYTLLSQERIMQIEQEFLADKRSRLAQKTLAYEVTKLVHGQERADSVKRISEVLFGGGSYAELTPADFEQLQNELPYAEGQENNLLEIVAGSDLAGSKSEARRFLQSRAIYLNGQQVEPGVETIQPDQTVDGYAIIRRGKNQHVLYRLLS